MKFSINLTFIVIISAISLPNFSYAPVVDKCRGKEFPCMFEFDDGSDTYNITSCICPAPLKCVKTGIFDIQNQTWMYRCRDKKYQDASDDSGYISWGSEDIEETDDLANNQAYAELFAEMP